MSSGKPEMIYQEFIENSFEIFPEREINISQLIIPFSKVFRTHITRDIYVGNENIPFNERDPEFKMILRQEFSKF